MRGYGHLYYVAFSPDDKRGIYKCYNKKEWKEQGLKYMTHLGFWNKFQAEIALEMGYKDAIIYREDLIKRGKNIPSDYEGPRLEW